MDGEARILPSAGSTDGGTPVISLETAERIVRVEEGIKHQGELLEKTLEYMEKRFEQVDKRFEQVDKRFEELRSDMNSRFNQMFAYYTTGIILLGVLMSVYQFLG